MTEALNNLAVMPKPKKERKASKRVRGQGTLFLRGAMWWGELNWKSTRHRKSLETTDRETALLRLDDWTTSIRSGADPKKYDPITVREMFDAWILECETTCKASTVDNYRQRWSRLEPTFGSMLAHTITRDKINEYLARRKRDGAGICARNRENRVLQMVFGHNRSKISPYHFPEFPKMVSERGLVRRGRLQDADYATLRKRLEKPEVFWLKVYLTMVFKYGFRKAELLTATCSYFDPKASTFTLPAYMTKSGMERVVTLERGGEIYKMLSTLTNGRAAKAALFTRNDGKPVRDFRGEWAKQTEGIRGGSGKGGTVTIHDLRRSAITRMDNKGITAVQAGTHLTPEVFNRYIVRNEREQQETATRIESD